MATMASTRSSTILESGNLSPVFHYYGGRCSKVETNSPSDNKFEGDDQRHVLDDDHATGKC